MSPRRTSVVRWETVDNDEQLGVLAHVARVHHNTITVDTFGGYVNLNGDKLNEGERRFVIAELTANTRRQLAEWNKRGRCS